MKPTAEKLEIIKWITELEDQSTIQQLKSFKEQYSSGQQVCWDTFSIDTSLSIDKGLGFPEKRRNQQYSDKMSGFDNWF